MSDAASSGNTADNPREFASRRILAVLGLPADEADTTGSRW
jgi:hypothetical protein